MVGVHRVDIVRNIVRRSDVDVTESSIAIQISEVEKRVEMMDTVLMASPCGVIRRTEEVISGRFLVKLTSIDK